MTDHGSKTEKPRYHTPTFDKIPPEKKKRIIDAAINEFAKNGYNATNINIVAKKAEISIGSMYSYFPSKEALILTILDYGYDILAEALNNVLETPRNFFEKFEALLRTSIDHALKFREINQIYLDASTEGLSHLAHEISLKMEGITAQFYKKFLQEAQEKKLVRPDLDINLTAFCLDNLIMMTQFSFSSAYYQERMKIYLGIEDISDMDAIVSGILDFATRGIKYESP